MSQPVGLRVPRSVALGAMIGVAAILAITALVLAQVSIPSYTDAKSFCSGHVTGARTSTGAGSHITWTAYYSLDAPDTVVAWYKGRLASGLHRREGKQDIWRVPFERPTSVLTVSAPGDARPLTGCTDRPPATARTVIVMSTIMRPDAETTAPPQPKAVRRSFPPAGITKLVLRAGDANTATVEGVTAPPT